MIHTYCAEHKQPHKGWWIKNEVPVKCDVCQQVKTGWVCVTPPI